MAKIVLVLSLWVCLVSISLADNTVVSSTNQVTKPGGQIINKTNNAVPSIKDMEKAADPSFDASELEAPVRWILKIIYYGLRYGIYTPISLLIAIILEPIILAYDVIAAPIKFFLGPIINPVTGFIGREISKTKNLIWWLVLEAISFGSGATAETISGAMQLALNRIIQFFTDIGLPVANTAEKLSKLTNQMAKSRSRRSIGTAVNSLGSGITGIIKFPFYILESIFSLLTLPFRIIFSVISWPFSFIFGGDNSTYTLFLTDMSTEKITRMVLTTLWEFMRDTGLPKLDILANKLKDSDGVPKQFRVLLSEFDSIYKVMKMLGYVK